MEIANIKISHPDKVLFPERKITKADIAKYYDKIAEKILPHLKDRPLTLHRFPSGINKAGFYQKNVSDYFPDFIKRIEIETEEGTNTQIICNNKKSLIYLVNQNTIALHIWLSRKDKIRQPDKVVFDLDPPDHSFENVKEAAKVLRSYLKKKKKEPELMTSGQNGLHIWYSIQRGREFDAVKKETRTMAEELVDLRPDLLTINIRKDQRKGKIFIDYLRNAYAQTSVCPYSLRANAECGIATPIEWENLSKLKNADAFNFNNRMSS